MDRLGKIQGQKIVEATVRFSILKRDGNYRWIAQNLRPQIVETTVRFSI